MHRITACLVVFTLALASASSQGAQRITIRVTPAVALEPAQLTIRTTVEPSDQNRLLNVSLISDQYSTSSDVPLEGLNAARLSVLQIRDVPSGLYEVRAVVVGPAGPLASTTQVVKIQPAPGHSR
jgi:hypothetical protein